MERQTGVSPMDFEWQTRAPGDDATSPFYQATVRHDDSQKKLGNTRSIFDSSTKKLMPSTSRPSSQQQPPAAQPPQSPIKSVFCQPAFMTPRKFELDFSSGAENMSSPENADNEDTPEQPSKTGKRNSLAGLYGRFAPSPGRGGIRRMNNPSSILARRVQKKRRRDKEIDRQILRDSEEEDSNDRPSSSEGMQQPAKKQRLDQAPSRLSSFAEFFSLLEAHPNVPNILSYWAQLFVNVLLCTFVAYLVFWFLSAIRTDFDHAAEERSDVILAEMAVCAKNYVDNRCAGRDRLPALEAICENWERCMNRDPARVGRAKLSAHTMAEIINNFIDPISWKAVVVFLATLCTVMAVSNWSFRTFRERHSQPNYVHQVPTFPQQPSGQHHPPMHSQQLPMQNMTGFSYFGHQDQSQALPQPSLTRAPSFQANQEQQPLMIEPARSMEFVTERSRERENHVRTPSPVKRDRKRL